MEYLFQDDGNLSDVQGAQKGFNMSASSARFGGR